MEGAPHQPGQPLRTSQQPSQSPRGMGSEGSGAAWTLLGPAPGVWERCGHVLYHPLFWPCLINPAGLGDLVRDPHITQGVPAHSRLRKPG